MVIPPPPAQREESRPAREPRDLEAEAKSVQHMLTHTPMNPYCEACQRAKMSRRPAQRKDPPADLINADYIAAQSEESMG